MRDEEGPTSKLIPILVVGLLIVVVILSIGFAMKKMDEQDRHAANNQRPTVEVYVDIFTKCQYLVNPRGGITPRKAGDGKQVCY